MMMKIAVRHHGYENVGKAPFERARSFVNPVAYCGQLDLTSTGGRRHLGFLIEDGNPVEGGRQEPIFFVYVDRIWVSH
jgi:hypothetical protein